jgi:hypothetical protein
MDREAELAVVRQAYAKQILAEAGIRDRRICAAFAQVRREHFLGSGRHHPADTWLDNLTDGGRLWRLVRCTSRSAA